MKRESHRKKISGNLKAALSLNAFPNFLYSKRVYSYWSRIKFGLTRVYEDVTINAKKKHAHRYRNLELSTHISSDSFCEFLCTFRARPRNAQLLLVLARSQRGSLAPVVKNSRSFFRPIKIRAVFSWIFFLFVRYIRLN